MKSLTIEVQEIRGGYTALITAASEEIPVAAHDECYGSTPRTIAAEVRDLIVSALTEKKGKAT